MYPVLLLLAVAMAVGVRAGNRGGRIPAPLLLAVSILVALLLTTERFV